MTIRLESVAIDANDADALAGFWEQLLGWRRTAEEDGEILVEPPEGVAATRFLFLPVPEGKQAKNRLHLDLRPEDQAAEVARAEALGARQVDVGQADDASWVVMVDPEGNEFCILRAEPD